MDSGGKCYFISDVHLGAAFCDKAALEARFVSLLDRIAAEKAGAVYLLGDIFDFWYEYRHVIPRGHTRALGALARLCDSGVKVYFMRGNHDVWVYDYFEREIGMTVLTQPYVAEIGGRVFCIGHGDGLGRTDTMFRVIRWAFHNRFLQILFSSLHPQKDEELSRERRRLCVPWQGRAAVQIFRLIRERLQDRTRRTLHRLLYIRTLPHTRRNRYSLRRKNVYSGMLGGRRRIRSILGRRAADHC